MRKKLNVLVAVFVTSLIMFFIILGFVVSTTNDDCGDNTGCFPTYTTYVLGKEVENTTYVIGAEVKPITYVLGSTTPSDSNLVQIVMLSLRLGLPIVLATITTFVFSIIYAPVIDKKKQLQTLDKIR